ncbi:hypothetical protein CYMTET_18576 [Cymbomonas tetramitiformis]|uniref:ABC transporter domain-containing protein n=1 Tax=Cymbomonas tetramitiformis TaxID=36881 RepID=A0AAE0G8E3_9CHLO|nr:hypothetical protein CYMTET_18576 [Cymbomonas tetramitiformis]
MRTRWRSEAMIFAAAKSGRRVDRVSWVKEPNRSPASFSSDISKQIMATEVLGSVLAAAPDARRGAVANLSSIANQQGVQIFKDPSMLNALTAAMEDGNKKKAVQRENACIAFTTLATELGPLAEPYLVPMLSIILKLSGDKERDVRAAADASWKALVLSLPPHAVRTVCPMVLQGMDSSAKAPTMLASCALITELAQRSPVQTASCVAEIVPVLSALMNDIKDEVKVAARAAFSEIVETINNRDIEPTVPAIIDSVADISLVPETVHKLAATTFVQTVDGSALGFITPLLIRALKEKAGAVKRQCAVIVANMSKLVENPHEAAPFLPELLPAMERATNEVSDPEARGVCEKAFAQLKRIEAACNAGAHKKADPKACAEMLASSLGAPSDAVLQRAIEYVAGLACSMGESQEFEPKVWQKDLSPYLVAFRPQAKVASSIDALLAKVQADTELEVVEEEEEDAEELCNCKFTLAYGSKILLHNTEMKLMRGYKYGLLGGNDCGKTTLMRSIVNGQVEGFPDGADVRTVFVEADILGDLSDLCCLDYVFADDRIKAAKISRDEVSKVMLSVGFTQKMLGDAVTTLSGGWRMKLALARAMLQKADILLMDEPTNHLDVVNVKWVVDYLKSLTNVTCIMVSHHSGLLDEVCSHILQIKDLKLGCEKGNLSSFVEKHPEVKSFFEFKATKLKFSFPQPGFIEGVKSKGRALMKMTKCTYTYPGNTEPTITGITVQVSLSSRVACVGRNGAGKSTLIKMLTGETVPDENRGVVWKHPNIRVAYVAQHAFHHIEQHLDKTPNQYIQWRYQHGEDKEEIRKEAMTLTEEEEALVAKPVKLDGGVDKKGNPISIHRVIEKLTGARKEDKKAKEYMYEVSFKESSPDFNQFIGAEKLAKMGFTKHMKQTDLRVAMLEGQFKRPLTVANVEKHLEDVGLDKEYGTHHRISALSGGQKVKVVIGAAMWNTPHIVILDEPTNYLDRESLGALAGAIEEFQGGVVMITHNNDFCSQLCPETWVVENGTVTTQGDPEWMKHIMNEKQEVQQIDEMVDGFGNTVKVKAPKKQLSRQEKKKRAKIRAAKIKRGEAVSDEDDEDWDE